MTTEHVRAEPARAQIDALEGAALLEFGTRWCGHCRAVAAPLAAELARHPGVKHVQVEDGPGRKLGRSFGVKLWPTLVFLRDGKEVERLVRPAGSQVISDALARIVQAGARPSP